MAVAGIGATEFHKRGTSPHGEMSLTLRALLAAAEDAGVDARTIDGFASFGHDPNSGTRIAAALGLRELRWTSMVWGSGGGGLAGAIAAAAAAVMSGQAERVAVVRAMSQRDAGRLNEAVSAHAVNGHYRAAGISVPAQIVALRSQRLFSHLGVPPSTQRAVALAGYRHARNNPRALGRDVHLDEETYEASRPVADPYRLFDCSRETDGAAALIVTREDLLSAGGNRPVYVRAAGSSSPADWGETLENDFDYTSSGFKVLAERMWSQTGLSPTDVDVIQVYENFTGAAVGSLIDCGFCTLEDAGDVLTVDNLTAPSGSMPINTAGGNVGEGFIHGLNLAVEAVRQIRGESPNQVPDASLSLLLGGPGDAMVSAALFAREPA